MHKITRAKTIDLLQHKQNPKSQNCTIKISVSLFQNIIYNNIFQQHFKMKSILFPLVFFIILLTSCGKQSAEYQNLKAQNDSLMNSKLALQEEVDGYFSAMNQIEQNIENIKQTQKTISVQPQGEEMDKDARIKINEDLVYLNEMLKSNKDELAKLKAKLKKSSFKSTELDRTITRLTALLEEESTKVAVLESKILEKDSIIGNLDSTVMELSKTVKEKETKIIDQEDKLNNAWYVLGTRKELKEQNIVSKDGLFSTQKVLQKDFNKNYFVKIDARKTKSIPLFSTRAKILTSHPKSSYTLEKENDNFVLLIVNQKEFWSVSKYLVVEID